MTNRNMAEPGMTRNTNSLAVVACSPTHTHNRKKMICSYLANIFRDIYRFKNKKEEREVLV